MPTEKGQVGLGRDEQLARVRMMLEEFDAAADTWQDRDDLPEHCRRLARRARQIHGELPDAAPQQQPSVSRGEAERLTDGDIGGLLEAIEHRCKGELKKGQVRRYGEIKSKLLAALSSRRLDELLADDVVPVTPCATASSESLPGGPTSCSPSSKPQKDSCASPSSSSSSSGASDSSEGNGQ